MGVVDEPVEDGVGICRIADDLVPFVDGDLAGEEGRAAAVAFFEDLVEVAAGAGVEGIETPIVEDEELGAVKAAHDAGIAPVAARQGEIGEQLGDALKAHKLHLASDRTSCTEATANQFRLPIHTAAFLLLLTLRGLAPRTSFWRDAQFDTIRLCLIKVAGRVIEMATRIKIALPTAYPYQIGFATLAGRVTKLPP